ncbi:beta-lactamase family protein [Rutstroemia sp. NJR-2017a BVV2]|nr:beta-lactamase family protein [Rutstroemia sp. NJR-2017a BVV2]
MQDFETEYENAHASGLLPGVVLLASNKQGSFKYSKALGVSSLNDASNKRPLTEDTILGLASCTKLMTAIAALQCVERGQVELDADVGPILPEVGKYGVITGVDGTTQEPILTERQNAITLRNLLTHTSGHAYDIMHPSLVKWREMRKEAPWSGETVEEKATIPLLFEPGTGWMYGCGLEWVGKLIERVNGESLEDYMKKNIWDPLGINDISFWPLANKDMKDRMADLSIISPDGKAADCPEFDLAFGSRECLGGGGAYGSAGGYMTLLEAVLREDDKLLQKESWAEFWKPQLDEKCKEAFNKLFWEREDLSHFLSINVPKETKKNFCFGGMMVEDEVEGWLNQGTVLWGGVPCVIWFIDRKAELCGLAGSQMLPPMAPPILKLHKGFQREVYKLLQASQGEPHD